jgi:uncharacterized Rmd1/YagE family protein
MNEGIFLLMFSIICFWVASFMRNKERLNALKKVKKMQLAEVEIEINEPEQ